MYLKADHSLTLEALYTKTCLMKRVIFLICIFLNAYTAFSQKTLAAIDSLLPVRGLAISAPSPQDVNRFVGFVENELAPAKFNMLILRVDWGYQFESRPELRDSDGLSRADVKKLVAVAKKHHIELIPQINLLGHQSWAAHTNKLLEVYPQFDETPHVITANYKGWPNDDGLYCKSYCPLHPDVHSVVFDVVDEMMDVFEASYFHAGMDEVFYIGDDKCPRCSGRDKAELFAGEVNKINNHLAQKGRRLMIWGDRLIDGKTTGMGMWEASMNNTHRAIDLINKDVFICDWHYERPDQTAVYFAMKGFDVATSPWRTPSIAVQQAEDMIRYRKGATKQMLPRYKGIVTTVWQGATPFMDKYYDATKDTEARSDVKTVKRLMEEFRKL